MQSKQNIAVVMGGPSHEHDISIKSGKTVVDNLNRSAYTITPIIINRNSEWIFYPDPMQKGQKTFSPDTLEPEYSRQYVSDALEALRQKKIDCVFNAMHGAFGEDGIMQGLLEASKLPYTGSPVLASSLAMDKIAYKHVISSAGIATARWQTAYISCESDIPACRDSVREYLGVPCVVKTPSSGSSIGVELCKTTDSLENTLQKMHAIDNRILIEQYLAGRELTCAVLGNAYSTQLRALPPTEIISKNSFFDFDAKYSSDKVEEITPANIPPDIFSAVQKTAVKIHNLLGCKGASRTDFILHDGILSVLETNTLPGLTAHSLLPKAAHAAGISLPELIDILIRCSYTK
ncbi:D-alanine--D-alanine ligase [bacterium]|nr:D-alanine--D-alanine ligase [bacterium]